MDLNLSAATIAAFKTDAKALRDTHAESGTPLSHAAALEHIAHANGAKDWNTLHARAARPTRLHPGDRVRGRYLGQPFTARVHAFGQVATGEAAHIVLHLDTPVDVVKFESFSSMRQRVRAVIRLDGQSFAKTSDGTPHLQLEGPAPHT